MPRPETVARLRAGPDRPLERIDEDGATVGITGEIDRVDPDDDAFRTDILGIGRRKGKKNEIAGRHIGDRYLGVGMMRHRERPVGQCGGVKEREVEREFAGPVGKAVTVERASRLFYLDPVPLTVNYRQGMDLVTAGDRHGEYRGRIETSAEEHDGSHDRFLRSSFPAIASYRTRMAPAAARGRAARTARGSIPAIAQRSAVSATVCMLK